MKEDTMVMHINFIWRSRRSWKSSVLEAILLYLKKSEFLLLQPVEPGGVDIAENDSPSHLDPDYN